MYRILTWILERKCVWTVKAFRIFMRKKLKKNGYGILSVFRIVTVFGTLYQL